MIFKPLDPSNRMHYFLYANKINFKYLYYKKLKKKYQTI